MANNTSVVDHLQNPPWILLYGSLVLVWQRAGAYKLSVRHGRGVPRRQWCQRRAMPMALRIVSRSKPGNWMALNQEKPLNKLWFRISLTLVSFSVRISRGLRVWRRATTRWKVEVIPRSTHLGSSKNSLWAWNARQTRNHRRKNQTHILIFRFTRFIIKLSQISVFSIGNPIVEIHRSRRTALNDYYVGLQKIFFRVCLWGGW